MEAVNLISLISFRKSTRPPTLLKTLSLPMSLTPTKLFPVNHPGPGMLLETSLYREVNMKVACGEQRQKGVFAFGNHLLQQPIKN